jgi:hypothetical protein
MNLGVDTVLLLTTLGALFCTFSYRQQLQDAREDRDWWRDEAKRSWDWSNELFEEWEQAKRAGESTAKASPAEVVEDA